MRGKTAGPHDPLSRAVQVFKAAYAFQIAMWGAIKKRRILHSNKPHLTQSLNMHLTRLTTAIVVSLFTVRQVDPASRNWETDGLESVSHPRTFASNSCYCSNSNAGNDPTWFTSICCSVQVDLTASNMAWGSDPNLETGQVCDIDAYYFISNDRYIPCSVLAPVTPSTQRCSMTAAM